MAEQSSTVAAFRALVMLICLILIPVAAFCGSSFPAVVKAIQTGRWPTLADFRGPAGPSSGQATEAPRFMPSPPALPRVSHAVRGGVGPGPQDATTRSPVIAANYTAPISPPTWSDTGRSTSFPQNKEPGIGPARGLSPLPPGPENLLSLDRSGTVSHFDVPASLPGSTGNSAPNDQLNYVLGRLRQLGATYFVLEPCGDEKREFRFFCQMSIGGNSRVTRPFWCFDGDPLKAMTRVLKQVEDWQSGGG